MAHDTRTHPENILSMSFLRALSKIYFGQSTHPKFIQLYDIQIKYTHKIKIIKCQSKTFFVQAVYNYSPFYSNKKKAFVWFFRSVWFYQHSTITVIMKKKLYWHISHPIRLEFVQA